MRTRTVDRLKCGLLPVDSTFFSVHIGHFLVIFRLKCGPKKVDSMKKVAFLVIFLGHFLTKMWTEKSGLPPQQFF